MRQETGSNPNQTSKKVSIQVKLGGRSFSADKIVVAEDIEQVEFVIDTPRVLLAPREEISLDTCVKKRISKGSTGPGSVDYQLSLVAAYLGIQ